MAISITNLGESTGAATNPDIRLAPNQTSYENSSWTPPTTGIICIFVHTRNTDDPIDNGPPTVSGNNLTWTQISTMVFDSGTQRITLFAAFASGATTGVTTIDFGSATQLRCDASFFQITGAKEDGTINQAFAQTQSDLGAGTSGSITLSSGADSNNRPLSCFSHSDTDTMTERTNWTLLDRLGGTGPNSQMITAWRSDAFETTASASWSTSTSWGGLAAEIQIAPSSTNYTKTITDDVGISDSMSPAVGYVKTLTDSVGISDGLAYALAYVISFADDVGISDAISSAVGFVISLADSVGITDAISRVVTFVRTFADDVGITDALTKSKGMFLTITDSVGISDIVSLESLIIHIGKIVLNGSRNFAKNLIGAKTGGPLSANTSYSDNKDGGL